MLRWAEATFPCLLYIRRIATPVVTGVLHWGLDFRAMEYPADNAGAAGLYGGEPMSHTVVNS